MKRNPTDSTTRNVQAANKKIAALTTQVRKLRLIQALHAVELKRHRKILDTMLKGALLK